MSATTFHIPFIQAMPQLFRLYMIWERKATAEHSVARNLYGKTAGKVVNDYQAVLDDAAVQLVVVSTCACRDLHSFSLS